MNHIVGRAHTSIEKKAIVMRLLSAWEFMHDMRLSQLIVNACGRDPFYLEDEVLVSKVEEFVSSHIQRRDK